MLEADVPPHLVAQLSGHKRVESLQSYHSASKKQQKRMSDILSYGDESAAKKRADSPSFICSKHRVHKSSLGLLAQLRRHLWKSVITLQQICKVDHPHHPSSVLQIQVTELVSHRT